MPESVDSPAPVSTTSRPSRSRSGTAIGCASTVTWCRPRSAGVARLGPRAALGRLLLAVLRRGGRHQVVEQVLGDVSDLVDGAVERLLVRRGRAGRRADLADELQGGVADLLLGRGRLEVVERSDVAAHDTEPTWAAQPRQPLTAPRPVAPDRHAVTLAGEFLRLRP